MGAASNCVRIRDNRFSGETGARISIAWPDHAQTHLYQGKAFISVESYSKTAVECSSTPSQGMTYFTIALPLILLISELISAERRKSPSSSST